MNKIYQIPTPSDQEIVEGEQMSNFYLSKLLEKFPALRNLPIIDHVLFLRKFKSKEECLLYMNLVERKLEQDFRKETNIIRKLSITFVAEKIAQSEAWYDLDKSTLDRWTENTRNSLIIYHELQNYKKGFTSISKYN